MMDSIASAAMSMKAAEFSVQYSTALQRKAMESMEMAAQELLNMLPDAPPMGQFIDTYA